MLLLPVSTGVIGYVPSLVMMAICWAVMTASGLLLLEVALWMGEGTHLISMTSRILGLPGKLMSWALFLFISYASLVAYTAEGGRQIIAAAHEVLGFTMGKEMGACTFLVLFGTIIALGTRLVGRVNIILFTSMVAAYVVLVGMGAPEVKGELLRYKEWNGSLFTIPLLFTAFSFQTMVPSLVPIVKRNGQALRWAIVGGTLIAFLVYAVWQTLILGIVPVEGANGLAEALTRGESATQFLREHVSVSWIGFIAEYFAFFAIVTSFLGMALGLFDFLSDGLDIKKSYGGRVLLGLLVAIPVFVGATQLERIFLVALETTGGFGDTILNGMMPVLMVWGGRYYLGLSKPDDVRLGGGKPVLALIFMCFFFVFMLTMYTQFGPLAKIDQPFEVPAYNIGD